jgi:hypothetical protein
MIRTMDAQTDGLRLLPRASALVLGVVAPNQVDYLLGRPLAHPPGTSFEYDTAAVHLLSVGLSQAINGSTETYPRPRPPQIPTGSRTRMTVVRPAIHSP